MITWENYEEYIMMYTDGELQPDEEQALMAFLNVHPELKSELALYGAARLSPDVSQAYAGKEELLRTLPAKHTISLPQWGRYSIAACIAALVFISFFKLRETNNVTGNEVAVKDIIKPVVPAPERKAAPQQSQSVTKHNEEVTTINNKRDIAAVQHKPVTAVVKNVIPADRIKNDSKDIAAVQPNTTIEVLPATGIKEMPYKNVVAAGPDTKEVPVYVSAAVHDDNAGQESFFDKLPIDNIKKKEMGNIAGAIANVYHGVSQAKQAIEERKFSIKIEKRKLILSF